MTVGAGAIHRSLFGKGHCFILKLQNNISSLYLATEEKDCKIMFLCCKWQLKKKTDLVFHF